MTLTSFWSWAWPVIGSGVKGFLSGVARGSLKAAAADFILDSVSVVMEDSGGPPATSERSSLACSPTRDF